MTLLTIAIIAGLIFAYKKVGLNIGSIIGGIIGLIIGSSLGVAGGGAAVSGIAIFGGIGFIIGGLMINRSSK